MSAYFVRDVAAVDLHLQMSAVALFRITNAPTIEATFGVRIDTPEALEASIATLTEMVRTWLGTPDPVAAGAPAS